MVVWPVRWFAVQTARHHSAQPGEMLSVGGGEVASAISNKLAAAAAACDATPALGFVVSTVGISLAGCVLSLAVACRARTFGLRLTACFALSVLIGLPVWLLPSEWCTSQALLEEFSYLSSMLWAVICLLHVYLVVNTGLRVAWRFEVFCHAVGWGVPLLSTAWLWRTGTIGMGELGVCWIGEQHVVARVLFFFAPLGLCAGALLVLLGFVSFKMTRGEAAQPAALCAARRCKLAELLAFVLAFLLLNVPHVALQLSPRLRRDLPCDAQPATHSWAVLAELSTLLYGLLPPVLLLTQGPVTKPLRVLLRARAAARAAGAQKRAQGATVPRGESDAATNLLHSEAPRSDHGTFAARGGETDISAQASNPACASAAGAAGAGAAAGAAGAGAAAGAGPLPGSPAAAALRVWTGTWNLGNRAPPARMDGWLPAPSDGFDVVVVAAQECGYAGDRGGADWFERVRAHLGPAYAILGEHSLRHIRMVVAVRGTLAPSTRLARLEAHGAGLLRLYGNKGAVGCTLWVGPTSLCFVGAHLAAHAHHLARRHEDLRQLLAGLRLGVGTADLQAEVHHLFLLGDLNYRLQRHPTLEGALPKKDSAHHAEVLAGIERREWPSLLQSDQLRAAVRAGFLNGFAEGPPLFAPTFKLVVGRSLPRP